MRLAFNGNYPMTRDFGIYDPAYAAYPGSKHPGTDWGLPADTQLVANQSGTVTVYDRDPNIHKGRGKEVVITNGNKQTKTCHMNQIDVSNGQYVVEGQPIGLSGYTGYVVDNNGNVGTPKGAHLHNELLIDGIYVRLQDNLGEEVIVDKVTIKGSPAAVSWAEGRIDVFACGSDNHLYQKYFDSTGWHDWVKIGDAASAPTVTSWAEGRLDIFFTGIAGDLVHIYYPANTANGFSEPEPLGVPKE